VLHLRLFPVFSNSAPNLPPFPCHESPHSAVRFVASLCQFGFPPIYTSSGEQLDFTQLLIPHCSVQQEIAAWKDINQRAAGAILLMLSAEERTALHAHRTSGSTLYAAIRQRHVQERPASRYNAYLEFLGLRRNDGEALAAFVSHIQDAMRHVQECRPATFSIKDLDSELMCMATLRALSNDPSCAVLVSTLLHSTDKLSDIDKLKTELVDEDMKRRTSPALYGLKADAQGVLRAAEVVDTANAALAAAAAAAQKKSKPVFSSTPALSGTSAAPAAPHATCAHCKGRHPTEKCYGKQIADLTKQLAAARGATSDFPESAGSTTTGRAHLSLAASNGADDV